MAKTQKQREQELNEQTLQQVEAQQNGQEDSEDQDEPEKLNRWGAAYKAIRTLNGDTDTLSHLAKIADEFFVAGHDGDTDYSDVDAASDKVQGVLEILEGCGLVELSWECHVIPLVDLSNVKPKSK